MEKVEIKQPIDLFIAFEVWSSQLKKLHENQYFRCMAACRVMKLCAEICEHGYHTILGDTLSENEALKASIETIALMAEYKKSNALIVSIAYALSERAENDPNQEKRSLYRKEAAESYEADPTLTELVSEIKKLCYGSTVSFKHVKILLRNGPKKNPLLQNIRQKSPA